MRLARRVAAGLVLGALIGFLAALLRPRSVRTAAPAAGGAAVPAVPRGPAVPPVLPDPRSPTVVTDPATRPIVLPTALPPAVTRGLA
jgi:hypothetical protein